MTSLANLKAISFHLIKPHKGDFGSDLPDGMDGSGRVTLLSCIFLMCRFQLWIKSISNKFYFSCVKCLLCIFHGVMYSSRFYLCYYKNVYVSFLFKIGHCEKVNTDP